jgi:2,5-diketo-D-gluconate reductase A
VPSIPTLTLDGGVGIPQLGFGVFQVSPEETQRVVEDALEAGYRHIDTAAAYRNERGVGAALRASGIPREELFVTTKLWNSQQGFDSALEAFEKSLGRLELDHVDLYLIHWPAPGQDLFVESWRALVRIRSQGRSRAIGVSNFRIEDLERLERETETTPAINQVELHPRFHQAELRAWMAAHGILAEAYSPLGQGAALDEEPVVEIARRHEKTPAQVVIRWHLQLGNVVIPKSATTARIRANAEVFDFELSPDEMNVFAELDSGQKLGPDPATFIEP